MEEQMNKTHWLQSPNKNYLGHWDLPNSKDVVLTIKSANWESVTNPQTNTTTDKRVIRFEESFEWLKPFICNETNAKTIRKVTGENFMEDCTGKKIRIGIDNIIDKKLKEQIDCLRVRHVSHEQLMQDKQPINYEQVETISELLNKANKDIEKFCSAYKINSISELPSSLYNKVTNQLQRMVKENEDN